MAAGALEEVALNLEEVADVTRRINTAGVGFFFGGLLVGAGIGLYIGYRWQREKLRADAFREAEEDVAKIKEYYSAKLIAAEGNEAKKELEDLIQDRGYSTHTDREKITTALPEEQMRPLPVPVPVRDISPPHTSIEEVVEEEVAEKAEETTEESDAQVAPTSIWNYPRELESRSPEKPYVIHQSELGETSYDHVTYTYYAVDDVLCDEDDTPIPHGDIVVGQNNLKWGHGSDDMDVVFVRNDKLELDMEICRSHRSYEEDVLGKTNDQEN